MVGKESWPVFCIALIVFMYCQRSLALKPLLRHFRTVNGQVHQNAAKTRSCVMLRSMSTGADSKDAQTKNAKQKSQRPDAAPAQGIEDLKRVRVAKLEQLRALGFEPFAYTHDQTHKAAELHQICADLPNGEEDESLGVAVCGRIMLRRVFGKLAFFQLQDDSGTLQLYIDKARLSDDSFDRLKNLTDAGDIIGVKGTMKRTDKVCQQIVHIFAPP